jgi:hypothetical protein
MSGFPSKPHSLSNSKNIAKTINDIASAERLSRVEITGTRSVCSPIYSIEHQTVRATPCRQAESAFLIRVHTPSIAGSIPNGTANNKAALV